MPKDLFWFLHLTPSYFGVSLWPSPPPPSENLLLLKWHIRIPQGENREENPCKTSPQFGSSLDSTVFPSQLPTSKLVLLLPDSYQSDLCKTEIWNFSSKLFSPSHITHSRQILSDQTRGTLEWDCCHRRILLWGPRSQFSNTTWAIWIFTGNLPIFKCWFIFLKNHPTTPVPEHPVLQRQQLWIICPRIVLE